jgi:hypothetical protein
MRFSMTKKFAARYDCTGGRSMRRKWIQWQGLRPCATPKRYYPGRAVACRTFDPHYRSETVEEIPPSSEGVAFKPATWCLLCRVYRTKDIGAHHVHPRVKRVPKATRT